MCSSDLEVAALHLEGEANAWWCSHLSHTRLTSFSQFTQELIRTFDGEISEEKGSTLPREEASTSAVIALREQPSTPAVGVAITWKEGVLATLQEVLKSHQGMGRFPLLFITENISRNCGNLSSSGPGSNIVAKVEQEHCTTM